MTMHINLSKEMEGFVGEQVAGGMYGNATEVIRDAVRRMQVEESRVAAWQVAIEVGDEQLDAGRGVKVTSGTLKSLKRRAADAAASGKRLHPDVLS